MKNNKVGAKRITSDNFRRYGWVIEYPQMAMAPKDKNLWKVIVRQPNSGWRLAYLVVRDRAISKLEKHPDSLESFEPVSGSGLLFVSAKKDLSSIECFLLNKPVILKKGIWHGVVTTSGDFDIKITENSKVSCVYWGLI